MKNSLLRGELQSGSLSNHEHFQETWMLLQHAHLLPMSKQYSASSGEVFQSAENIISEHFDVLWITKNKTWSQETVKHAHIQTKKKPAKTNIRPTKIYPEHIRKRPRGTYTLCHFHMRLFTLVWIHRSIQMPGINKASSTDQLSRDQPHLFSNAKLPAGWSPKSL